MSVYFSFIIFLFFSNHHSPLPPPSPSPGSRVLVPLTSSLYIPGTIAASNEVLVDVGTGFYVAKSTEDAIAYLTRKQEMLRENIMQVQTVLQTKRKSLETISTVKFDKESALQNAQDEEKAKLEGLAAQ